MHVPHEDREDESDVEHGDQRREERRSVREKRQADVGNHPEGEDDQEEEDGPIY